MFQSPELQSTNADVFITSELDSRLAGKIDYRREKLALQDLAACMADKPDEILPRLVDLALDITGAETGGISLYEKNPAPGVFRWRDLRGRLAPFDGECTPRHFSPCGITLDQRTPVLARNPETIYGWLAEANIFLPEVLLVPLYIGGSSPLGTLWVVSDENGRFNREHARVLIELASFVDIALRMVRGEQDLRMALDEQEMLTREMNHRVQNLFAVTKGLIRMSGKSAASADELAGALLERLAALQRAHGLIRGNFTAPQTAPSGSDLADLIHAIVEPHDGVAGSGTARISIDGPSIRCGEHVATAIALVFHELATNAAKYGALSTDDGHVAIGWRKEDGKVIFHWAESGGPAIDAAPAGAGFGTKLVTNSVGNHLGGAIRPDWRPGGLVLEMEISADALAN